MIDVEDLLDEEKEENIFKYGRVVDLFENGLAQVRFDGEESPSEKSYTFLDSYNPAVGDRVLLAKTHSSYIIFGKLTQEITDDSDIEAEIIKAKDIEASGLIKSESLNTGEIISSSIRNSNNINTQNLTVNNEITAKNIKNSGTFETSNFSVTSGINTKGITNTGTITTTRIDISGNVNSSGIINKGTLSSSGIINANDGLRHRGTLGFFGAYGTSRKNSVNTVSTNADVSLVASKVNELINALTAYGLV